MKLAVKGVTLKIPKRSQTEEAYQNSYISEKKFCYMYSTVFLQYITLPNSFNAEKTLFLAYFLFITLLTGVLVQ